MKYDFNTVVDRKNSNSLKYDCAKQWGMPEEVLPMWVADMDFKTAPEILEEMKKGVEFGIFGYSIPPKEYNEVVVNWFKVRFGWEAKPEWIVKTPGVVFAISTAVRALTNKGDAVLIQQPVYYPFRAVVEDNERVCINSPLILADGRYGMDYEDMEKKIIEHNIKLFILCSPHNPVGRVWSEEELSKVLHICKKHQVFIISDEIHCDFTYPGYHHTVLAKLAEDYLDHIIICTSTSKSFNLAGLQLSHIFIPDEKVRDAFRKELYIIPYDESGTLALIAGRAAYEKGGEWLEELKSYLLENVEYVRDFLGEHLPKVKLIEPQGTYLIWLDFREYGLGADELQHKMLYEAGLWLDEGIMFGEEGAGFMRVNIACPKVTLEKAMEQLKVAFV